jgi:hypothetical protein
MPVVVQLGCGCERFALAGLGRTWIIMLFVQKNISLLKRMHVTSQAHVGLGGALQQALVNITIAI